MVVEPNSLLLLLLEWKLDTEVVPEETPEETSEVVAEFLVSLDGEVARSLLLPPVT
jgi:hypothetical protein